MSCAAFCPKRLRKQRWRQSALTWDSIFSNLLESGCSLSDLFSSDQLSNNHQFEDIHSKRELLAGKLHRIASRGQPLAVGVTLWELGQ